MAYSEKFLGIGSFIWFTGVVEDRMDPEKLGRLRVRCFGFHNDDIKCITYQRLTMGDSQSTYYVAGCQRPRTVAFLYSRGFVGMGIFSRWQESAGIDSCGYATRQTQLLV